MSSQVNDHSAYICVLKYSDIFCCHGKIRQKYTVFLKPSCNGTTSSKILLFLLFSEEYYLPSICKLGFKGMKLSGSNNCLDRLASPTAVTPLVGFLEKSPVEFDIDATSLLFCHAV